MVVEGDETNEEKEVQVGETVAGDNTLSLEGASDEDIEPKGKDSFQTNRRRLIVYGSIGLLVLVITVGLSVGLALKDKKGGDNDRSSSFVTESEAVGPTASPSGTETTVITEPTNLPTMIPPTASPTISPTAFPTSPVPSSMPSFEPSNLPTENPTTTLRPTQSPTRSPTLRPTLDPTKSQEPTLAPTGTPTNDPTTSPKPTNNPTFRPTSAPSLQPTNFPTTPAPVPYMPGPEKTLSYFLAIGDVPYTFPQEVGLIQQINDLDTEAEFLIHVGDIRTGDNGSCRYDDFNKVNAILNVSKVPVFIVPGDNEWNDCSNPNQGWEWWTEFFMDYPDRYWKGQHGFKIERHPERPENWAFVHKGSLFLGLNIVGGRVHDRNEWRSRLSSLAEWSTGLMRDNWLPTVIFAHAEPNVNHNPFFVPVRQFISDELQNSVPVLYLNGDRHKWQHDRSYLGESNWERITLVGGVSEPPLMVNVDASHERSDYVFRIRRR